MKNTLLSAALLFLIPICTNAIPTNGKDQIPDTLTIPISDKALECRLRNLILKPEGNIQYQDVKNISSLTFDFMPEKDNTKITNISVLKYFTSLLTLSLSEQGVRDISSLSKLQKLESVNLNNNRIIDLSPIKNNRHLKTLLINNNLISDISVLSNLLQITRLEMEGNSIKDIGIITLLPSLTSLRLNENPDIHNMDTIKAISGLVNLEIKSCNVKNLNFLRGKNHLQRLIADRNQIESIEPLLELKNLACLLISQNKIKDLKPLKKMFENGCFYGKPHYYKKCHIDVTGNPNLEDAENFDIITFLRKNNIKINL